MPLDASFIAQQVLQFKRELIDIAKVYVPVLTINDSGENVITWPEYKNPNFEVICLFLGGGGSAQERQIATKVEAPIVASILIAEPDTPDQVIQQNNRVIILQRNGTEHGPYEVLAPPVPRSYGVSYRVVLGSV